MASFTIQFNKPNKKYNAGESVHCKILIVIHSKFKARSLTLRFLGVAHTEWTKSGHGNSRILYVGHQEYFRKYINFFGQHDKHDGDIYKNLL